MELESTLVFAADHPAFAGHFPGAPIVPGVLLLDAALHALETGSAQRVAGIASTKFLRPVAPGESLSLRCTLGEAGRYRFEIECGDQRAATGQLLMAPIADER